MKYLHTMVRVSNLDASLDFYCAKLGLKELRRMSNEKGRYTLVFLAAPADEEAQVELTYNWDPESYTGGRNFGHLAYAVEDIYATCQRLQDGGGMATWRSCAHPMAYPSSCCRTDRPCRRANPGLR